LQGAAPVTLCRGRLGDLDALVALENAVFATDILSRSFCRFLAAPNVAVIVAEGARQT
jgi:hypothetical protein